MKNLSELQYIYSFTTILVITFLVIMVVVYIYLYRKKSELLLERQCKEKQFQQELTRAIIEMKETTLSYIGQELHDDLGQKMSVAKLMINHGLENAEGEQKEILLEIDDIIGDSIRGIRSLSKSFISEQIENLGLIESINKEVARIDRLNLMLIKFSHNVDKIDLQNKDSLILFRIVQECINNVLKHSRAKNLEIIVFSVDESVEITLKDDGIGFKNDSYKKGSGLIGMQKRANLINTDFSLITDEGLGTTIFLRYNKNIK
ncbi:sensor histidine kinase [Halpernia sp. GG3]